MVFAKELGAHRGDVPLNDDPAVCDLLRRSFWSLHVLDSELSAATGRPPHIALGSYDAPLPIHEWDGVPDTDINAFVLLIEAAELLRKSVETMVRRPICRSLDSQEADPNDRLHASTRLPISHGPRLGHSSRWQCSRPKLMPSSMRSHQSQSVAVASLAISVLDANLTPAAPATLPVFDGRHHRSTPGSFIKRQQSVISILSDSYCCLLTRPATLCSDSIDRLQRTHLRHSLGTSSSSGADTAVDIDLLLRGLCRLCFQNLGHPRVADPPLRSGPTFAFACTPDRRQCLGHRTLWRHRSRSR